MGGQLGRDVLGAFRLGEAATPGVFAVRVRTTPTSATGSTPITHVSATTPGSVITGSTRRTLITAATQQEVVPA